MPSEVYILSGCSGSGKSTEVEHIRKQHAFLDEIGPDQVTICSADHYFLTNRVWDVNGNPSGTYNFNPALLGKAHGECLRRFIEAVQQDKPVVIVDNHQYHGGRDGSLLCRSEGLRRQCAYLHCDHGSHRGACPEPT